MNATVSRVFCCGIDVRPIMQGLFVPYARVGSGDPVRVLRLFHNKYSGYCCIHLLCKAMYNLSLPRLSANYYGLPATAQLRAAHESRCSLFGVSWSTAQVLYCTCLEQYILDHSILRYPKGWVGGGGLNKKQKNV